MHVWVEPLDWDVEKGPPPIAQLDVHAINYLREKEVRGSRAVSETEAPCKSILFSTHYANIGIFVTIQSRRASSLENIKIIFGQ